MKNVILIHGHDYGYGKPKLDIDHLLKCSFEKQMCRKRFAEEVGMYIRSGWGVGMGNY